MVCLFIFPTWDDFLCQIWKGSSTYLIRLIIWVISHYFIEIIINLSVDQPTWRLFANLKAFEAHTDPVRFELPWLCWEDIASFWHWATSLAAWRSFFWATNWLLLSGLNSWSLSRSIAASRPQSCQIVISSSLSSTHKLVKLSILVHSGKVLQVLFGQLQVRVHILKAAHIWSVGHHRVWVGTSVLNC